MSYDLVKANLNLYAVLQNLEDLVKYDTGMASLIKDWNVSIQFSVKGGPHAHLDFKNGACVFGRGKHGSPSIKLFFTSPKHLNAMFDNKGTPIPLKGFTKLGFLTKDFPKLTDRLTYYLKPTDELMKEKKYMALNTRMTLNTAIHAVRELALLDPIGQLNKAHIDDGAMMMKILPDGPAAHIIFRGKEIEVKKGECDRPMSIMTFRTLKVANDLFNNKIDAFAAVASGDVAIWGHISMVDAVNPILDRIPVYLS